MGDLKLTKAQQEWIERRLFPDNHWPQGKAWVMNLCADPMREELQKAGLVDFIRFGTDTWWVEIAPAGRTLLPKYLK